MEGLSSFLLGGQAKPSESGVGEAEALIGRAAYLCADAE